MLSVRAVLIDKSNGTVDSMRIAEVQKSELHPGDALVAVVYGGCNVSDTIMRRGIYPHPKGYPLVAGIELSGIVEAVGPGVTLSAMGDRVAGFSEEAGGFAEFCCPPALRLACIPARTGRDVATAFYVQAFTAWHLLRTVSTTKRGDNTLVHAIVGGVGLCLTQLRARWGYDHWNHWHAGQGT